MESIEHAVGEALRDVSLLPASLPMTAAAMGVVPQTTAARPGGPAGDAPCAAPEQAAGSRAPAESAAEVVAAGCGERRVRSETTYYAPDMGRPDRGTLQAVVRILSPRSSMLKQITHAKLLYSEATAALRVSTVCHSA